MEEKELEIEEKRFAKASVTSCRSVLILSRI
jgi:hypothetical protein